VTQTPNQSLDGAFDALARFKPGDEAEALAPIDKAVAEVHGRPGARAALEQRLASHLGPPASPAARAYVCRELARIGSAASVPALAPLLADEDLSLMARHALERIPGPEADKALRDAVAKTQGRTRAGIIDSIGVRRDARSVAVLVKILGSDPAAAPAAAKSLGEIGTVEAADALEPALARSAESLRPVFVDGALLCA
jgi:HEAT repeat protein